MSSFDLYQTVTDQIVAMLESGVVPWRSPILGRSKAGHPKNLNSGKQYRGVNVFLLAFTAFAKGYANRRRIRGPRGKRLMKMRGELIERSFAHNYENRRDAADASSASRQYRQTAAGACRRVQSEPGHASIDRFWEAPEIAGAFCVDFWLDHERVERRDDDLDRRSGVADRKSECAVGAAGRLTIKHRPPQMS